MKADAWHYELKDGTRGTISGEHMPTKAQAIYELAFKYQARAEGCKVRKAGEEYEHET